MKFIDWYENNDGCWICNSHSYNYHGGYPQLRVDHKNKLMSRHIWEECFGEIPDRMCVCHKCDNPGCINPEHLFLGTQSQNIMDSVAKRRAHTVCGEQHYCAKLKEKDIINIMNMRITGTRIIDIAKLYSLSEKHTADILHGRAWKHITKSYGDRLIRTALPVTD